MVFIDVTARNAVQSPTIPIVWAIAKWVANTRDKRKKKATLQSLLFAPEHRLRDLGISREELLQALARHNGDGGRR